MLHHKTISLIMPCRNEGQHLGEILKLIPDCIDEIIIVSNNSTDDTVKQGKKLAKVETRLKIYEDNRTKNGIGYGYAHMTGINRSTGDLIVAGDGDGTYPFQDITKIAKYLLNNDIDFISCNRYPVPKGVRIPAKLQLGVNILNLEIALLYGLRIRDALSGMWLFRKDIAHQLNLTEGDWNLSPQIKLNAATNPEIKFAEHHIHQNERYGETKQKYLKTGFSHLKWILQNRFRKTTK